MKNIIIPLVFATFTSAFGQQVTSEQIIKGAAEDAVKLNQVVADFGTLSSECREETKTMNRKVLVQDKDVKPIACVPDANSLTAPDSTDHSAFLKENNIEIYPDVASVVGTREFRLFIHEIKKFPAPLLREIASVGGKMRIFMGDGVTVDPEWNKEKLKSMALADAAWAHYHKYGGTPPSMTAADVEKGYSTTTEGTRNWDYVSGSGGGFANPNYIIPTRIVINRMYKSKHKLGNGDIVEWDQGASNLVLHEHGHALDSMYGHHAISGSAQWKAAINDPKSLDYVKKVFSDYESNYEEEGFAEAFSFYHSCEASRVQMETEAPALASFFKNLTSVKALRPDLHQAWKTRYKIK